MDVDAFLQDSLVLDLEVGRDGAIFQIGAMFNGITFERQGFYDIRKTLAELDAFARPARTLIGHNLIGHDLPILRSQGPDLHLLGKLVVDTLYLSPLAFPQNPYHHLVKEYKLVRDSVNNPLADVRQTIQLFKDEWDSLAEIPQALQSFYRFCFQTATTGETASPDFTGLVALFERLGAKECDLQQARQYWRACVAASAYCTSVPVLPDEIRVHPAARQAYAYGAAWLRIAGGNSVVPGWVRHQFPQVPVLLDRLRQVPCEQEACGYCRANHHPQTVLQRYFDFPAFRPKPATPGGGSLQEAIVRAGMGGQPLLAIMPTGGGKSLCYQLPALTRHFRRGVLTIVISPLQALMKDQVDNLLERTGGHSAAALYGMLTSPERGEVLERVRLGDVAIVYVSPEQLRNRSFHRAIAQREIGGWVFDEAHCISKWGHDFRPDYLYALRFIREFAAAQGVDIPPISCFTATARPDVQREIVEQIKEALGQQLQGFTSTVERDNLHFEVQLVSSPEKNEQILQLLDERLPEQGSAIIYVATRQHAEDIAEYLSHKGVDAVAFHAGLENRIKRHVQQQFVSGATRIICATNAFGLGIDKEDVRLIIHADLPGTLENYIQEAGRAGRDLGQAHCILLYDKADVDRQFSMGAMGQISRNDIAQILRGLRKARKQCQQEIVITAGDLVQDEDLRISFDGEDRSAETRVRIAVAWLERAGFIQRNENRTRVFQGKPLVKNMEEGRARIRRMQLSARKQAQCEALLEALFNADPDQGMNVDQLAELPVMKSEEGPGKPDQTAGERVMRLLHDMTEGGVLKKGVLLTAFVRHKVQSSSLHRFKAVCALEKAMLDILQETAPEAPEESREGWLRLSLAQINQRLKDQGLESNPEQLRDLLKSLAYDRKGMVRTRGGVELQHTGQHNFRVRLHQTWPQINEISRRRQAIARLVLEAMLAKIPPDAPGSSEVLVEFSSDALADRLRADLFLAPTIKDMIGAIDRALMFLNQQKVIVLQNGLAVFRQAMTIQINPQAKGRRYTLGDFEPLKMHYAERIFQVHVMNEYAQLATANAGQATGLVLDYFTMERKAFVERYFPDREKMLSRAATQESFKEIVDALKNPVQQAIVAAPDYRNMLVLAGPGSGKTTLVVHRCAYLLCVERVPARKILVLCFNHNAAITLRQRLRALVGAQATGVLVMTYHALAMRLTGTSLMERLEHVRDETINFDGLITDAVDLLQGKKSIAGWAPDELRDRLLAGYQYILVDEYQDIDQRQYDLISALAGRVSDDPDEKLNIMAVGDDDQNIYTFRGANVQFIRRFQEDYQAKPYYMVENYRSTRPIIDAANGLIRRNQDRMKTDHPIEINKARKAAAAGGPGAELDPFTQGRVQVLRVHNEAHQAVALVDELRRLQSIHPGLNLSSCAVLARTHEVLQGVRTMCEANGLSVSWPLDRDQAPRLYRIREIYAWLEQLKRRRDDYARASDLRQEMLCQKNQGPDNPWWTVVADTIEIWEDESGDMELPIHQLVEFAFDVLAQQQREYRLGTGVFLGTVHSAKGMEFDHVYVLDGGWKAYREQEEERRLFYVGMTRAKQTLGIFSREDQTHPHIRWLTGDSCLYRRVAAADGLPEQLVRRRYALLGLRDLFIDYPGRFPASAPIHQHLHQLHSGQRLLPHRSNGHLYLADEAGVDVARLSERARGQWEGRMGDVQEIRVMAMLQRFKGDSPFGERCRCEQWELPLVEMIYN